MAHAEEDVEDLRKAAKEGTDAADRQRALDQANLEELKRAFEDKEKTWLSRNKSSQKASSRAEGTIKELESALAEERNRHEAARTKFLDLQAALDAAERRADSRIAELDSRLARAEAGSQTSAALAETLSTCQEELEQAKRYLSRLSTQYGDLARSSVAKHKYDRLRMEAMKNELLIVQLRNDVEELQQREVDLCWSLEVGSSQLHLLRTALDEQEIMNRKSLQQSRDSAIGSLQILYSKNDLIELRLRASELHRDAAADQLSMLDVGSSADRIWLDFQAWSGRRTASSLRTVLEAVYQTSDALTSEAKRVASLENAERGLRAELQAAVAVQAAGLENVQQVESRLAQALHDNMAKQSTLEQAIAQSREDVLAAESALAEALEKAADAETVAARCKMAEDGLKADIEG